MKIIFFIIITLFCFNSSFSQARLDKKRIANKSVLYNRQAEERFVLEVKTIDEFMERFNYSESTLIRQYLEVVRPNAKRDRKQLLKTLFESKALIADSLRNNFIDAVCDSTNEEYLNFFQGNWYAQAQCLFNQGTHHKYLTLILKVQRTPNGGSKWVIAGAEEFNPINVTHSKDMNTNYDSKIGLNPYSHVLNFTELEDAFDDIKNINSYLDDNFITEKTKPILDAIITKKINFRYVQNITYHFLQIDGWIFTVEQYKRMTRQAGWLINQLQRVTQTEKEVYKQKILYLN